MNSNCPPDALFGSKGGGSSAKISADIYIDDRNIGGIPEWGQIYEIILGKRKKAHRRRLHLHFWR